MNKAKLYVRGMKDPIELEPDEAKAAQELIADFTADPMTPFSIEGVWAGKKVDMKFVTFDKKQEERRYGSRDVVPMTDEELALFEIELSGPREKAREKYDGRVLYLEQFWLASKGLIRMDWFTAVNGKPHFQIVVNGNRLDDYNTALATWSRYSARQAQVEFGKQQRDKQLAELAQSMTIDHSGEEEIL